MNKKIVKKLFGFSMSSWITAVVGYIGLIISTHLYDEYDLGIINFFISIITILCSILNLALDQGYLRFGMEVKKDTGKHILTVGIISSSIAVLSVWLCSMLKAEKIAKWLFGVEDRRLVYLIPICVIGLIIIRFTSLPWRLRGDIIKYTIFSLMYSLTMKIAYIFGIIKNTSWMYSLITYTSIICLCAIISIGTNYKEFQLPCKSERKIYKSVFAFSLPLIPAMLMVNLNNNIPQIWIRNYLGFSEVALYSAAVSIASAINILQSGFNAFWTPYVYANYKDKKEEIQKMHEDVVHIICFCVVLFILLQNCIFLFFKQEYAVTAKFLPFLILTPLTYTIGETTQIGISIAKKSYISLLIYLLGVGCNIIGCNICVKNLGIVGAALSAGMTSIIVLGFKTYLGNKLYKSCKNYMCMIEGILLVVLTCIINLILYNMSLLRSLLIVLILIWMIYRFSIIKELKRIIGL